MVDIYLAALVLFGIYKMAKALEYDPNEVPDPDEDIEGHIAGINESETPEQVMERYQQGNRYNELRSEAFIEKMAEFHQNGSRQTLS